MKRYLIIAALAVVAGLVTSSRASAQLSYAYSIPASGGVEFNQGTLGLSPSTSTTFYSPFTGLTNQTTGSVNSLLGGRATYSSFYSPFVGQMSQTNRIAPSPFGNITYSTFYSPYTGSLSATRITPNGQTPATNAFTGLQYNYATGIYGYNVPSQAANPLQRRGK
jgi:hypothetical protein